MENRILTIKKLENGRLYIDFHKYLINLIVCSVIIFPIVLISSKNLIFPVICTVVLWIVITIIIEINDYFGKKIHHKIFERRIFQNLRSENYHKEIIGKYEGLIKTIDGRTIRIFYNWNKIAKGFFSFGDIEIDIFFQPQIIGSTVDEKNIKFLNNQYFNFFGSDAKSIGFTYDRLKICFNYYPWTTSAKIEKEILNGLEILKEHNLKPFDISNIKTQELIDLDKDGCFLPDMEHIWDYVEENKKLPISIIKI